MSQIAEFVKEVMATKEREFFEDKKRFTITIRVDEFTVFCLEKLQKATGMNKTALSQSIVEEGLIDGLEVIGLGLQDLQVEYISKKTGRKPEEVRADLDQTGIFVESKRVEVA